MIGEFASRSRCASLRKTWCAGTPLAFLHKACRSQRSRFFHFVTSCFFDEEISHISCFFLAEGAQKPWMLNPWCPVCIWNDLGLFVLEGFESVSNWGRVVMLVCDFYACTSANSCVCVVFYQLFLCTSIWKALNAWFLTTFCNVCSLEKVA